MLSFRESFGAGSRVLLFYQLVKFQVREGLLTFPLYNITQHFTLRTFQNPVPDFIPILPPCSGGKFLIRMNEIQNLLHGF